MQIYVCEKFVKEGFDKQHMNASSFIKKVLAKVEEDKLCQKCSCYLKSVVENIRLFAFVELHVAVCLADNILGEDHILGEPSPTN